MLNAKDVGRVVHALFSARCYQATLYLSERQVITATIPRSRRGKAWDKRFTRHQVVLKVGVPNYRERLFLANHKLPTKVQLRDFPKPR